MATRKTPKPRKYRLWIVVAVVAAVLYFVLGGTSGVIGLYRMHAELKALEQEIERKNEAIDSLSAKVERLRNDFDYVERMAREELGMAKENEKVYKFVEEK